MVYNTDKILKENRDKISEADAAAVESALSNARRTADDKSADAAALNSALDELTRASHKLAEVMYQKTASQAGSGPGQAPGAQASGQASGRKDDDVIDAEYVDVDDKK
jgi:molecular chaperone DnaK